MNINIVQQHLDWFVIVVNCIEYIGWQIVKLSQISFIQIYIQIWKYNWPTLVKCYQATLVHPHIHWVLSNNTKSMMKHIEGWEI